MEKKILNETKKSKIGHEPLGMKFETNKSDAEIEFCTYRQFAEK